MSKISTLSKRTFLFTFIEEEVVTTQTIHLDDLMTTQNGNEYEYIYAIGEEIDKVLDLKVGEHHRMKFNRDNFDSQGVIKRIK